MTRKHYDSPKLRRYDRRKLIRRSLRYRLRKWSRRVGPRVDTVSGFIRIWALLTLGAYFLVVYASGPGSGLLPAPYDEIVCWVGGAAITAWKVWDVIWDIKKQIAKQEREAGR